MKAYDFSPLAKASTTDGRTIAMGVGVGVIGALAAVGVALLYHAQGGVLAVVFFSGFVAAMFIFVLVQATMLDSQYAKSLQQFVARNHLAAAKVPLLSVPDAATYSGAHDQIVTNAYTFMLSGAIPCTIYEYSYTVGNGKFEQNCMLSVAQFGVGARFPELFLDGRHNNYSSKYQSSQRVSLEGNFDTHFNLYVPDGKQVDALSIIAPDVMQLLVDEGSPYDISIDGRNVYVIAGTFPYTQKALPALLDFASRLHNELHHRSVSWREPLHRKRQSVLRLDFWSTQQGLMVIIVLGLLGIFLLPRLLILILGPDAQ
jgi:hypothetical protein